MLQFTTSDTGEITGVKEILVVNAAYWSELGAFEATWPDAMTSLEIAKQMILMAKENGLWARTCAVKVTRPDNSSIKFNLGSE